MEQKQFYPTLLSGTQMGRVLVAADDSGRTVFAVVERFSTTCYITVWD